MILEDKVIIEDKKIGQEIERFLAITTRIHWEKLIQNIENDSGIFYKNYQYTQNPLAKAVDLYNSLSKKGKSIWRNITQEIYFLGSIAHVFNFLYKNFNNEGKKFLLSRIRSYDIRSILFEFKIITHLLRNSFSIELNEYDDVHNTEKSYDILAIKNDLELEIECKYKEYDSKRKITRPALYLFYDLLLKDIEVKNYNCIVSFEFKNKLVKDRRHHKDIVDNVKNKLDKKDYHRQEYESYFIEIFPVEFTKVLDTTEKLSEFIQPFYKNNCHFASLSTDKNNFLLRFITLSDEHVVEGIYKSLNAASKQFSKTRAGIISCHIEGIYPDEWIHLQSEGGLFDMSRYFLLKENKRFIHSITYSSTHEPLLRENIFENVTPYFEFKNPNSQFYNTYTTKELFGII